MSSALKTFVIIALYKSTFTIPYHTTGMDYDYVIDVVAGSKACIAGYSAVQAYITDVWVYYRHI